MWSPENPDGDYPTAGAHDVYLSDRTNSNWKYFILKNIQVNYDLAPLLKIKSVKSLKVNLNFQNFVTFVLFLLKLNLFQHYHLIIKLYLSTVIIIWLMIQVILGQNQLF